MNDTSPGAMGSDQPRTYSTAIPAIPMPQSQPAGQTEDEARARIAQLEREAKALGPEPAAAILFHEIGLLWESPLKHPRNAAVAYQAAYKLNPMLVANIRAARRLFSEVGNWVMVVQLLDAEIAAVDSERARAGLLFEKGVVLESRLSREADAMLALEQCLSREPEDVTLLCQLEQLFGEKGDAAAMVKVQKLLARVATENNAKAHYLTSAGLLLEDRIKDFSAAAQCFREAFALDRRDTLLLSAMKRVAQRENTPEDELAALAAEAEGQGAHAAPTFLQISKAYERLGRPEDALAALTAARRVAPNDPLVLSELARIFEARERHEELADVLAAWVKSITDESECVALNLRLASLYEDALKRDADAVACYEAILERSPGHPTALQGMGKLHARMKNWPGLLETYQAEAKSIDDPKQRATRIYKAGEVLEERLDRPDEAIAKYNECLLLSPGYLPAQKALIRLFEKHNRWADLVAMYEQDLLQTTDREQQVQTLNRMAGIYEDRLTDLTRATDCLKRVLEVQHDHLPTIHNLQRVYERSGQYKELIELNEVESTLSGDTRQVVSLIHRNAEILEDQMKDRAGAIAAYERVLALSPTYPPALKALGRLYATDGKWSELIKMCRAEAEIAPSTDQAAALIFRVGELYEQKLKDDNSAIASYQEVLTLAPNYFPAVRALARIYRTQGAWESLIEILRAEAANRSDPSERANAMFQAAAIWEDQLKKPEKAIEGYNEVLRLAPNHPSALQQLERILTTGDDVKELIVLLDRQAQTGAPRTRVSSYLKLARLYLDRLNENGRAGQCCEAALNLEPDNLTALKLLERVKNNDKSRRAELRARIAEVMGDPKLSAAMRLASDEMAAPPVAELKSAWLADPADEALGALLEKALRKADDSRGLIELYERRSVRAGEADKVGLQLRIAELAETRLGDWPRAAQAYEASLTNDPSLYPALLGLSRVFVKMNNPGKARHALETIGKSARDPATAIEALLAAGKIARDQMRDADGAAGYFRLVLEKQPLHPEAGTALEDLLASRGGATDLVALHERRGEAKAAMNDPQSAAREFFSAARVVLEQLKDKERASALLERSLMANPTQPDALELKGDLALDAQNYPEAAAAYAVRVQQGGDARALAGIHLKLGALYHDRLNDAARAAGHLSTVLSSEPNNLEALERLGSIHSGSKNWTGAADCYKRLLEVEPDPVRRSRFALSLARVYDEGFADAGQAAANYRLALQLAPGDSTTLDRLVELYEKLGNLPELVTVLEQQAMSAPDVRRAISLRLRIGELYARPLDNAPKAITTFRGVLDLDTNNTAAHAALADLYARDGAGTAMAVESHRSLLRLDPTRVDSLHALFRLWESVKQLDRAFCAAGVLTFYKAANDVETAFYNELRGRLSQDLNGQLSEGDLSMLHHPGARNPLTDVLRAVGDQFGKLYPPQWEQHGMDRKADRLKSDHAVYRAVKTVAQVLGATDLEVYQAKRGLVFLETGEPLLVCVGQDVVRRFNLREQRFLIGRAALGLYDKTAVLRRLSTGETADVFGNSVRIHFPQYEGLGRRNDDHSKALRKAYSRKSIKLLEEPAGAVARGESADVNATVEALAFSADRAGLLFGADIALGLGLLVKEELPPGTQRAETTDAIFSQLGQRRDLRELVQFAVSDDFFRLRQRLGLSLG